MIEERLKRVISPNQVLPMCPVLQCRQCKIPVFAGMTLWFYFRGAGSEGILQAIKK